MTLPSKLLVAAGAAVLFLSSSPPLTAIAAASARASTRIPVVRTRTLVLEGAAGYVDVRIPRRTAIDTSLTRLRGSSGPNRHVRISGEGPFTGILMAPVNDQLGVSRDRVAVVGQFEGCSYGCTDGRRANFTFPMFSKHVVLRPNVYRIYFMAGDSPSRVAVTFLSGRKGKTFVTPSSGIDFSAAVPAAAASSTPTVFSAGADYSLSGEGLRFSVMDLTLADGGSDGTYGSCLYESQDEVPDESKFLPGCPEGAPAYRRVSQAENVAEKFMAAEWEYDFEAGSWAHGMWYQSSVEIQSVLQGTVFLGV
ncbi:MAG TPA: hypothetical protein VEU29_04860 [Actinomycetota bacterium]|nr:hypothetical protein [Actinomycetota bacterium]